MILNHFVTASFNNAIYLQVAKISKEYNCINRILFLFYENIIVASRMKNILNLSI